MAPAAAERTLHRYELLERIGVGGMAEVFRAKASGAHGFEKNLAIKRILPDLAGDPEFVERFISEAKLAVALSHANIVQVLDFGKLGGTLFIAMELIDGPDLAALMRAHDERRRAVPLAAGLQIAMELAEGLEFAHRRGVVHRDISPSNLLLSRAGETKIADFGVALAAGGGATRRIMGKWRYMSPEQARGQALDSRSDIFSAAVVIHELLTGRRLFPGDDVETVFRALTEGPIPAPSSLREGVPHALDGVLAAALEREPARRTANAGELLRGLREASYGAGLVATALDVAEAVAWAFPAARLAEGTDVDAAVRAELGQRTHATRVTERAAPPAFAEDTRVTFVARGAEDGIPRFEEIPRRGRRWWPYVAAGLLLLGGLGTWRLARRTPEPVVPAPIVTPGPKDAALRVESTPAGATVLVDGAVWGEPTPATVRVTPARPHRLEVRLPGYRTFEDAAVVVESGERVVYRPVLERSLAHLRVTSEPAEAEVLLDEASLGPTPLSQDVGADGAAHTIRLRKKGYLDVSAPVTLADGADVRVERTLEPAVRVGAINLYVEPWADVYLDGRKLGEAPISGLRLPVGKQRLRLVNPVQKRETTLTVDVPARGTPSYRVTLP